MAHPSFSAKNHFVPDFYLKQWASAGTVKTYRGIVEHAEVPLWKDRPTSTVAKLKHLYTQIVAGAETDELEKWFGSEFETPGAAAIRKVLSDDKLSRDDYFALIRFLAAQDVRNPRSYFEDTARWDRALPALMQASLNDSIQKVTEAGKTGAALPAQVPSGLTGIPLKVVHNREAGKIGVEILNGRQLWLRQMKRSLERTAKVLHEHRWTILEPPTGMRWFTSDDPVVRLNFVSDENYNLRGGWKSLGTDIFFPLSPKHLLFTQIGKYPQRRGSRMERIPAERVRRFTAEHAFRHIFSDCNDPDVPKLRPRIISAERCQQERTYGSGSV